MTTTNMVSTTKIDQLADKVLGLALQEDQDTDSENIQPSYAAAVGGKLEKASTSTVS